MNKKKIGNLIYLLTVVNYTMKKNHRFDYLPNFYIYNNS